MMKSLRLGSRELPLTKSLKAGSEYKSQNEIIQEVNTINQPSGSRADVDNYVSNFDPNTQYLIITNQSFLEAVEPLATWKHQKGIYTSISVLDGPEGISATYKGHDLAAKIHAFLRDYYFKSKNLKWLLLVGDSEIIPARLLLIKCVQIIIKIGLNLLGIDTLDEM